MENPGQLPLLIEANVSALREGMQLNVRVDVFLKERKPCPTMLSI
jgi:hypothetical protein